MRRLSFFLLALLALAGTAEAQTGTITTNGQCRSIDTDNKGQGTLEVSGTWTGTLTWYVSNGVARAAIDLATPSAPGTAVNSTTANGHWFGNVGGWRTFEVCATATMTGTATIWLNASDSGGGGGGAGGGGAGTSDTTEATQLSVLAGVDGIEALLGTTNTSLAIIDNIVFGAGTAAAAQRVTFASDAPAVTVTDGAGALNVICDSGCAGSGGTSQLDGATFTPNTTSLTPAGGLYETTVSACTSGDTCAVGITTGRAVKTVMTDTAGAPLTFTTDPADEATAVVGTTPVVPIGFFVDDTATDSAPEGSIGMPRMTADRRVIVSDGAGAMNVIIDSGTTAVTATNLDVQIGGSDSLTIGTLPALVAGTATIGYAGLRAEVGGTLTDLTAATEGSITAQHVIIVDPVTDAAAVLAGACTPGSFISAGTVNETEIKATAGQLDGLWAFSLDATPVYLKLYNDTAANIDETDTPVARFGLPANATAANGAGNNLVPPGGMNFSTAIVLRATSGIADNSTGVLTASEVLVTWCSR